MFSRFCYRLSAIALAVLLASKLAIGAEAPRTGVIDYSPPADESKVPERFRLASHSFEFQQKPLPRTSTDIEKFEVTFPSPVTTEHEENNTVHCEYFRPVNAGPEAGAEREEKSPGVIVLHILGGDFELSRAFCQALSHRGSAALFVKMPYYGPRRPPGHNRRMIATDPRETVAGMTQAILDIRRAVAWLGAQEEIDPNRLGVFGISLGGITGALAATAEPRLANVCLLLAGGDIGQVGWEAPELAHVRKAWLDQGGTREEFFALMSEIDPAAYGENARGRRILMLNAERDEVIPKSCTEALWKSLGEPEIEWYPGGHYSVIWRLFTGINRVTRFFVESP